MKLHSEYWDRCRALDAVGGDAEFLSELAGIFCAACPTLLKSLGESIAAKNLFSVADTAHLLWSAARSLSAPGVAEAALALETMARRNEINNIDSAYHALQQEAGRLGMVLPISEAGGLNFPLPDIKLANTERSLLENQQARLTPRYSFVVDIELTDVQSGSQIRGQTKNLCLFGCGVDTLHLIPTGTSLTIKLSHEGASVAALARVVYARADLGLGIVFTGIEPEDERILAGWISELASIRSQQQ
jgi:HPt (histidine-containing phosphotransfer) domain-containing protein